jgi:hypothetical protein
MLCHFYPLLATRKLGAGSVTAGVAAVCDPEGKAAKELAGLLEVWYPRPRGRCSPK